MKIARSSPALRFAAVLLCICPALSGAKPKAPTDHWVGTWSAGLAPTPVPRPNAKGAGMTPAIGTSGVTLRETVHTSLAGALARVELTNEFGTEPLTIGAAHLALAGPPVAPTGETGGEIVLPSANALTFNGSPSVTIPPGQIAISDPASIAVPFDGNLTVSLFLPAQKISVATIHSLGETTSYVTKGNVVGQKSLPPDKQPFRSWYFLKSVDVKVPIAGDTGAIVAFGDSITDGVGVQIDQHGRWPEVLADRLHADPHTKNLSVLNVGISGNRILKEGTGPSALSRFQTDVLDQPGVQSVVILEGINDIGEGLKLHDPQAPVTAADLIGGLTTLARQAHAGGVKVFGATITPYMRAGYSSPAGETVRNQVNDWIRTTRLLDGFVDFDKATRDPAHPDLMLPAYDRGDHLHPQPAGYKAMGDAIDLKLFYPVR